jgi:formylglycine-generating enzyme required for sulfatase activity
VPFAWDNELDAHEVDVAAFSIDAVPVRNAEFAEFVTAGGYARREWWEPDDFAWAARRGAARPHAWVEVGGRRAVRTLAGEVPFDEAADWPVQVSYAEAAAYARWRGAALPTEAQVHRAAYGTPDGGVRAHPWGEGPPGPERGNFGLARWAPAPVGSRPAGASAFGVHELVGNGWEWTRTPFAPHPGFRPWARTYPGYSRDFFDGRHRVLLGGSFATDATLLRRSFRNWFQTRYPYVFSKFRCVEEA